MLQIYNMLGSKILKLILVFIGLMNCSFAQIGGYNTHKFLNLPNSARITALGGYLPAVKDADLNNAYQNPSLLNEKMDNRYALNISNYLSDIQYGYIGTAQTFKNFGTFGIGIQYINYGEFESTNDVGEVTGTFTANENALHFSYANQYHNFSYGASLKTVFTQLESYHATAIALDLGGTYADSSNGFTAAFVLRNMGSQVRSYYGEKEALPFEALFAVSKKLKHAPFRFSVTLHNLQQFDLTYTDPNEQSTQIDLSTGLPVVKKFSMLDKLARHVALGTEVLLTDNFNLRIGYNHQKRKELAVDTRNSTVGFSWGFGLKIKKINFSYGSARVHLAGSSNMFSLSVNPSDFFHKK